MVEEPLDGTRLHYAIKWPCFIFCIFFGWYTFNDDRSVHPRKMSAPVMSSKFPMTKVGREIKSFRGGKLSCIGLIYHF